MPPSHTQTILKPTCTNPLDSKSFERSEHFRDDDFAEFLTSDVVSMSDKDEFGWPSIAVEIKRDGVWRVHQNDPDKYFPSDFHADRIDKPEKLDLYTGAIYSKSQGKYLRSMNRKVMRQIHSDLKARGKGFLDAKLDNTDKFSYLN